MTGRTCSPTRFCHQVSETYSIAVLTIVLNNAEWDAVRHSVLDLYPTGYAAKAAQMPLTRLSPSPDFARVAEACGAYAERVCEGTELDGAIRRAIDVVTNDRRQVVLDVLVSP